MSRRASPFRPAMVLGVLVVGALAFLLMLYALGQGWTGDDDSDGGTHAASTGLTGFAGLATLLDDAGYDVELSRRRDVAGEYGLLVLTPPVFTTGEDLQALLDERREVDYGPTMIILPKWAAYPIPEAQQEEVEAEQGWVYLFDAGIPRWFADIALGEGGTLAVGETRSWNGFGRSGDLPDEDNVQALTAQTDMPFRPLVVDSEGDVLAGVLDQPTAAYADYPPYPVIVVFEPDLMNNYGMADRGRAELAAGLVTYAMEGEDMPVIFDLTLAGLGASENLLTLAFSPPFLAATLCLLLAALVIAWRGFRRFGPPVAETPAMARGKRQLARNGAALVARVKRFHLLKEPYEALVGRRIASHLGLRVAGIDAREIAIDKALQSRGHDGPSFAKLAGDLREAHRPADIVRAAGALRQFERNLTQ